MDSLKNQVGGSHYKDMKMQPIQLIAGAKCDFVQGNIIKYVSRYKHKDGKKDLEKVLHYAKLALDLYPENKHYNNVGLGFAYCKTNDMTTLETSIVISALQHDYKMVEQYCNQLIAKIYG